MLQVSVKLEVKTIIYDYIIHFLVAGALYFFIIIILCESLIHANHM